VVWGVYFVFFVFFFFSTDTIRTIKIILKPPPPTPRSGAEADPRCEEFYARAWRIHRNVYAPLRGIIATSCALSRVPSEDADLLLGVVAVGADLDGSGDILAIAPIGGGAPGPRESLWRAYGQLREFSFARNDGYPVPPVLRHVAPPQNQRGEQVPVFAFLSPTGRTHYSRALAEGPALGAVTLVTRWGKVVSSVLEVADGYTQLTEDQLTAALQANIININNNNSDSNEGRSTAASTAVTALVADARHRGSLTAKGCLAACIFARPVPVSGAVSLHHHPLDGALEAAGYPATDKSRVLFELTYDKSKYPQVFHADTGVHLPQEVHWHATTERESPALLARVAQTIACFAAENPIMVVKGAAESGARNLRRFDFPASVVDLVARAAGDTAVYERFLGQDAAAVGAGAGGTGGRARETAEDANELRAVLADASGFVLAVSRTQNVVLQRAIVSTPLAWLSPGGITRLIDRQATAWGVAVRLAAHPRDFVYGSLRVIMTAGVPKSADGSDADAVDRVLCDPAQWAASHSLHLASLQIATNVGRQGTLEVLSPAEVDAAFPGFAADLEEAGRRTMAAMAAFGRRYWHEAITYDGTAVEPFGKRHPDAPEHDAVGVPYWWPRYSMLDFVPEPVWSRKGSGVELKRECLNQKHQQQQQKKKKKKKERKKKY
jgi:hypothetical protein